METSVETLRDIDKVHCSEFDCYHTTRQLRARSVSIVTDMLQRGHSKVCARGSGKVTLSVALLAPCAPVFLVMLALDPPIR